MVCLCFAAVVKLRSAASACLCSTPARRRWDTRHWHQPGGKKNQQQAQHQIDQCIGQQQFFCAFIFNPSEPV